MTGKVASEVCKTLQMQSSLWKYNLFTIPLFLLKIIGFSPKTREQKCGCICTGCIIIILTVSQGLQLYISLQNFIDSSNIRVETVRLCSFC